MKTIVINKSNIPASPLVSVESIYNVSPLFASSKPVFKVKILFLKI